MPTTIEEAREVLRRAKGRGMTFHVDHEQSCACVWWNAPCDCPVKERQEELDRAIALLVGP